MKALAASAALERDIRAKHFPAMVARGELYPEDAQHDWRCWSAIADLMAGKSALWKILDHWFVGWDDIERAALSALEARQKACDADPAHEGLRTRLDAVRAISARMAARSAFYRNLNAELHRQAAARQAA